jgi:hypothetical protein
MQYPKTETIQNGYALQQHSLCPTRRKQCPYESPSGPSQCAKERQRMENTEQGASDAGDEHSENCHTPEQVKMAAAQ